MAQNYIFSGERLDFVNLTGDTVTSGSPIQMGGLVGIVMADVLNNASGVVAMEGVFELPRTIGIGLPATGVAMYWDGTGCTTDPTAGFYIGRVSSQMTRDNAGNVQILLPSEAGVAGAMSQGAAVVDIATANASDLATAEALANATKLTVNALLDSLRTAGIIV